MHDLPKHFHPSPTLRSRNFVGLVSSQFLAAFNDQASHIVAIFYATDMLVRFVGIARTNTIVTVVTACFITPFFLFSPLAGVLADRHSKRAIIVFWKIAEVGIMALAVGAFLLPHASALGWISPQVLAEVSSVLIVSLVFLMGTHSAFFIPAKYGMMPEILHTSVLSRGNGILEGTSFLANIMGTMFGGLLKSTVDTDDAVNEPRAASFPSPLKFWVKMPGVPVGVSVEVPSNVPEILPACAEMIRQPRTITRLHESFIEYPLLQLREGI